jgi:hypothetical protein
MPGTTRIALGRATVPNRKKTKKVAKGIKKNQNFLQQEIAKTLRAVQKDLVPPGYDQVKHDLMMQQIIANHQLMKEVTDLFTTEVQ